MADATRCRQRDWDDAHLINAAVDIHHDDPAFGYRFIADELRAPGHHAPARTGCGGCAPSSGSGRRFAKKTGPGKQARPAGPRRPGRSATSPPTGPNELWLTDITEHPTDEGKLYLCAIKDVYSNRIVGYSIDDRMTAALAVSALRNAIALRRPGRHAMVHSDRGSNFDPAAFVRDAARTTG